jgi:insulysin
MLKNSKLTTKLIRYHIFKKTNITLATDIIKASVDKREYRTLVLPENGLRVLLVSDVQSKNAYAAVDVHAGSWQEPSEIPGLAHFLEHMLFLRSEAYPQAAYFDKFLSQNGGFSNAFTSDQHTNFFFQV